MLSSTLIHNSEQIYIYNIKILLFLGYLNILEHPIVIYAANKTVLVSTIGSSSLTNLDKNDKRFEFFFFLI